MPDESFSQRFRWLMILTIFGGIFVPSVEKIISPKLRPLLPGYLFIFYVFVWTAFVDTIFLMFHGLPFDWMIIGTIGLHFCINSLSMYMLTQQQRLAQLIQLWEQLDPQLMPEKRREIIERVSNTVFSKFKSYIGILLLSCATYDTLSIFRCSLILPSIFGIGFQKKTATLMAAVPQSVCFMSIIITYSAYQCLMEAILRLILSEFQYLRFTLESIMADVTVSEDGCNTCTSSPAKFLDDAANQATQSKLETFLKYHIDVLRFCKLAKNIYEPTVLFEYFGYGLTMSIALYGCIVQEIQYDMILKFVICFCFFCVINGFKCRLGDNIRDECVRLGQVVFHGNWMAYPLTVKKNLMMLINISQQRPVMFEYVGIKPLLVHTFGQMLYMQYTFVRFVYDTMQK